MNPKPAVLALSLLLATAAFAQSTETPSSEFQRGSGGSIDLITKRPQSLDGSFLLGTNKRYGATLGGTLMRDRVWFFASAEQSQPMFTQQYATPSRALDAKAIAQIGDRQNLSATFASARTSALAMDAPIAVTVPSSFLALHYTGMLSNNMMFSASFSQLERSAPRN